MAVRDLQLIRASVITDGNLLFWPAHVLNAARVSINFLDGHAKWYKTDYVQNPPSASGFNEPLNPEIIWDAAYRDSIGQ